MPPMPRHIDRQARADPRSRSSEKMNRKPGIALVIFMLLLPLLAACGASVTAQQEPPTPTPLPPDPALERPTYTVKRGDTVKAGDVLAELQQDEALNDLRDAEDGVVQAKRDLADAQKARAKNIKQAEMALENAQEDIKRLLHGGDD